MTDDYTVTPSDRIETLTDETAFTRRQAEVWVLTTELGWTVPEAAEFVGIEEGTAATHRARARQKIADAEYILKHTSQHFQRVPPNADPDEGMVREVRDE